MKKKTIVLLLALVMVCMSVAPTALAVRANDNNYTVSDLLHKSTINKVDCELVELSFPDSTTTALPLNTNGRAIGDIYYAHTFDENNQFLSHENKLRWLVNHSVINDNISLGDLKDDINNIAQSVSFIPSIIGPLSYKDAVVGAQFAIMELVSLNKTTTTTQSVFGNGFTVYLYYKYMFSHGGSQDIEILTPPIVHIDIDRDDITPISTVEISSAVYKVVPYTLTHSNNGDIVLSLSVAPTGSYIDDITSSAFNVYIPANSITDPTSTTITVFGTITASIGYMDICTFSATAGGSILLGECTQASTVTASDTHTSVWVFPDLFTYELTLIGKQSQMPISNVEFTFSNASSDTYTRTTDAAGKIVLPNIECDTFYLNINKVSATNANLDTSLDEYSLFTTTVGLILDVTTPGIYKKTLEISELPASICLYKYCDASDAPLPFAVFGLFELGKSKPIAQVTSDVNGKVLFANIYPGDETTYKIRETSNPVGYSGTYTKNVTLSRGEDADLSNKCRLPIFNRPIKVPITAFVKDEINLDPIQNAIVAIYTGDYSSTPIPGGLSPLMYGTTDSNGKIILSGLRFRPASEYTIVQTDTIAGYDIDTAKYLLTLASIQLSREVTFYDPPRKGTINVEIVTSQDTSYYDGMEFLLIGAPEYPTQEQNRVGAISNLTTSYTSLYPGTYKLHQVVPPIGYTESTTLDLGISVTLHADETLTITLEDDSDLYSEGDILLMKVDDSDNPLAGALFNLYLGSKAQLDAMTATELDIALLESIVSDALGQVSFGQFRPGTYTIVEVSAPTGYVLPTETEFEITFEDGNVVVGPVINAEDSSVTPVPTATSTPTTTTPPDIPATGEGSLLYILAGILAVLGLLLFIFRKKILKAGFEE